MLGIALCVSFVVCSIAIILLYIFLYVPQIKPVLDTNTNYEIIKKEWKSKPNDQWMNNHNILDATIAIKESMDKLSTFDKKTRLDLYDQWGLDDDGYMSYMEGIHLIPLEYLKMFKSHDYVTHFSKFIEILSQQNGDIDCENIDIEKMTSEDAKLGLERLYNIDQSFTSNVIQRTIGRCTNTQDEVFTDAEGSVQQS